MENAQLLLAMLLSKINSKSYNKKHTKMIKYKSLNSGYT